MKQDENTTITTLPEHGLCFVCGQQNPNGMGITWYTRPDDQHGLVLFSDFAFTLTQQGPPGHAHGGASAAVLDEAMGAVCWQTGLQVLLANRNLDYHLPVPLGTTMRLEAWVDRVAGRKAFAKSHLLLPTGETAVSGTGLYIHSPALFDGSRFSVLHGKQPKE